MGEVRDAVILAGGKGTRMLPASLYIPKETLPLIDTPLINHLIWEAAKAGVRRVHVVLSEKKKDILEDFFERGTIHNEEVRRDLPRSALSLGVEGVEIIPHVQRMAGGVADAISSAISHIDGPFIVLLGDMLLMESHVGPSHSGKEFASSASLELVSKFRQTGLPNVGVCSVPMSEVGNYGVVELSGDKIIQITEKPELNEAPGNLVLCGRYLFTDNVASILEEYPVSKFGEMQSIHIMRHLIENSGLNAVILDHMKMYDSGDPLSWLKSQVDHALNREDMGDGFFQWIKQKISGMEREEN